MHFPGKKPYIVVCLLLILFIAAIPLVLFIKDQKQPTSEQQQQTTMNLQPRNPIALGMQIPKQEDTPTANNTKDGTPVNTNDTPTPTTPQYPDMYLTPVAGGAQYYVSPSGSDSNDGSLNHPFATIQKAANVVTPGSIVFVLPGTYTSPVVVQTDGTAAARISFVSTVKWGAQIKTTGSTDPWNTRADYIDIIGFDITSTGARDGLVNFGSYTRTIANHVHDVPGICDTIGGSGISDEGYTSHDNDLIA